MVKTIEHQLTPWSDRRDIAPYIRLMDAFLIGELPVAAFERRYLDTFADDDTRRPEPLYEILNEVFLDVDAFYPDAEIRGEFDIDEEELRRRVQRSLAALRQSP